MLVFGTFGELINIQGLLLHVTDVCWVLAKRTLSIRNRSYGWKLKPMHIGCCTELTHTLGDSFISCCTELAGTLGCRWETHTVQLGPNRSHAQSPRRRVNLGSFTVWASDEEGVQWKEMQCDNYRHHTQFSRSASCGLRALICCMVQSSLHAVLCYDTPLRCIRSKRCGRLQMDRNPICRSNAACASWQSCRLPTLAWKYWSKLPLLQLSPRLFGCNR